MRFDGAGRSGFRRGSVGTRRRRADSFPRPPQAHSPWSSIPNRKLAPRGSAGRCHLLRESSCLKASQSPLSKAWPRAVAAVVRQSLLPLALYPSMAVAPIQRRFVTRPNPDEGPVTFDPPPRSMSPCPPPRNAGPEKVQNPLKARRLRMQMRWYHDSIITP